MSMKNPLFLKFVNKEIGAKDLLMSFSGSPDPYTSKAALAAMDDVPDLEGFRKELSDAVNDLVKDGPGEEFKAFVNHYMESSLEEDIETENSQFGENVNRRARVKDASQPWVQGILCYNLCLYIKAFGLEDLKSCRVCGKVFSHKGKYAVYCGDACKSNGKKKTEDKNPEKAPGWKIGGPV